MHSYSSLDAVSKAISQQNINNHESKLVNRITDTLDTNSMEKKVYGQ